MLLKDIENIIIKIQPYYNTLNSNFSKSYLIGSSWYVGDDLLQWWKNCNNIGYFKQNKLKLIHIIYILLEHKKI